MERIDDDPGLTFLADPDIYSGERFAGRTVTSCHPAVEEPFDRLAWLVDDDTRPGSTSLPGSLDELLASVGPARVQALAVTGRSVASAPEVLAGYAGRLPALRSVFLGFVPIEHWEMSWIGHGDITPVLEAYPELERLEVRGSGELTMRPVTHECLKVLRFESGGLPGTVVRAVGASTLPALEHLELWLGTEAYHGDHTIADLDGILSGAGLPALRRLGLRNSEQQNEVAAALAAAPVVAGLEELSLGRGVLMDGGMEALLSGQPLTHLRVLDLHHHYLSGAMEARVREALPGVTLELTRPGDDDGPYIAVAE
ncbi:hypothetical protein HD597_008544 [Nonomuraea thailandensis]|uniref:Leucine-rich repeat domain-containing protein n=1 Tax=Nonomuraea thailandensis TaxID=1188745 RepID=A0A9X2K6I6_9ACTN|nr:STM4015 family protein [Nonomuraea thailandensis]MCP2361524.1 hypothetical protein [Nonomuraea thailandensis]